MCGILGGLWPSEVKLDYEKLSAALSIISHRGPDDSGIEVACFGSSQAVLGHTRLSIIDLSASGHQPMFSEDNRFAIVFNGEVYNYIELRGKLKSYGVSFKTDTDTEVLLKAWMTWGEDALKKIIGMFAFSVYDFEAKTIHSYRDAFGIKPFYYHYNDNRYMFASEVKPLLDLIDEEADANLQKAYDYLVFGEYDSNEETFFNNIYQLQPGTGIKISIDNLGRIKIEKRKWWCATKIKPKNITYDDAVRLVRDEFLRSVKLHLRSDVPLGVALSGGLDSSALVCAMRKVAPDLKIHTFSFISEEPSLSEEIWVDKVNTYVSAESHKVKPSSYELGKDLITMIDTQGEPFGSTSIYAQFRVFQLAKEHGITVTLDGQGADELLGGYDGYPEQILRGYFKRFQFIKFLKFLIEWSKWPGRNISLGVLKFIQATIPDSLYGFLRDKSGKQRTPSWLVLEEFKRKNIQLEENRRNNTDGSEGVLTSYLKKFLGKRSLPSLLRHADRNSMNFSIESRVPFLTIPLAELMLSLKDSYLVSEEGQTKNIFRDAMKGIVPEDVLFRRDKVGFVTSEHLWMSQLSSEIEEWIASAENIPFICSKELKKNFSLLFQGKREFDWQFWRWINYIVWYDRFILKNKKD